MIPMSDLSRDGFALHRPGLAERTLGWLRAACAEMAASKPHGVRDVAGKSPAIREFAASPELRGLLPPGYVGIRSIFFDKVPGANWKVAWHQDLTIAVAVKAEVPGFGPWSVKGGVPHVQPPAGLLESMLTLRVHLDAADDSNGALRVIPGSHRKGRLGAGEILAERRQGEPFTCRAEPGDVLIMRPLLLHASSPAVAPSHRRVLHFEFAPSDGLAPPLAWSERF